MQNSFNLREFILLNDKYNERNFTEETMYFDNDYHQVQILSRWAMWSFNGILIMCLMSLVWVIIGFPAAALLGLLLAVEPTVAAHLPVVMTDLPVALALACGVMAAVGLIRHWSIKWMLMTTVFSAVALGTKFSAITGLLALYFVLGSVALKPILMRQYKHGLMRLGQVLVVGIFSVFLLWSCYGFQYHAAGDGTDSFNRTVENKIDDLSSPHYQKILTFMDGTHVLPRAYIWGLADTIKAGVEGRGEAQNFIFGTLYKGPAPWFYWPAVMVSKSQYQYSFCC